MKSLTKIALVLAASLSVGSAGLVQAQQRRFYVPSFTPPAQRPVPQWHPQQQVPENHPYNNYQPQVRPSTGENHPNATVVRPSNITPVMRRAMTYNTRPNGVHITPEYFAGHFGRGNGFHFNGWGPGCPTCGFTLFNGEWYFGWNGATFGVMGQIPGNWALATDYLYIDIGDDGNYYLYDSQFPDFTVQLTFVQNMGDDQAGDDDQG